MHDRHGARTPLTAKYWEGASWAKGRDCGQVFEAVKLDLRATDGGPAPSSKANQRQVLLAIMGLAVVQVVQSYAKQARLHRANAVLM